MLPSPVPVLVSTRWWGGWLPAPHSPRDMMDGWVGGGGRVVGGGGGWGKGGNGIVFNNKICMQACIPG